MMASILVVDDEQTFLDSVEMRLNLEGYDDITLVVDPTEAPGKLEHKSFDIALLDITMPKLSGLDLLKIIKEASPQTECIMITANDDLKTVVQAVKRGAYDYLIKPIMPEQLALSLDQALERKRLMESLRLRSETAMTKSLKNPEAFKAIVTGNKRMIRLLHETELHAVSDIPILIQGETGVGKELLAHAVHMASRRAKGPFVPVNMLALSPTLFESEFFGHAKGAFTGADRERAGYLGKAQNGTLFLDEIGDLSMEIQGKLLRILQEGEYTAVGKTKAEKANVRFIAATNQNLEKLVDQKKFRKDLFYRLQFARLALPPLKERKNDILTLAGGFLKVSTRPDAVLSQEAEAMLVSYDWPGNIRELKGVLEAAANLAEKGKVAPEHLSIRAQVPTTAPAAPQTKTGELEPLAEVEKRHILAVLDAVKGNKSRAAKELDIGLQTLYRKLKSYGVS
jgi:DNA-binding NtrC family response regulator